MSGPRACVDVGSTWTKGLLVDPGRLAVRLEPWGEGVSRIVADGVLATAQRPTTSATDVMVGVDAVLADLASAAGPGGVRDPLVCSSAGGGLRLAVVGYERAVTAEAGRRAALSAGGRVVHVATGHLDPPAVAVLLAARPDVVLLSGGTDGGDTDVLLGNAAELARTLPAGLPVVVAGNADAAPHATAVLTAAGVPTTRTGNVLPDIGVLQPGPAREALRAAFLRHVIGGRRLTAGSRLGELVRAATPDAVLAGVEVLTSSVAGGVLVVDVGGATTDVYSVLDDASAATAAADVAGAAAATRTVEGDLGLRWSAPGVLAAAAAERLDLDLGPAVAGALARRPDRLPEDPATDTGLARVAATVAVRRHARAPDPGAAPRPLRDVGLVVGSGGALRHGDPARARQVLGAVTTDHAGRWHVPDAAALAVDTDYVLCALGLLALAQSP